MHVTFSSAKQRATHLSWKCEYHPHAAIQFKQMMGNDKVSRVRVGVEKVCLRERMKNLEAIVLLFGFI